MMHIPEKYRDRYEALAQEHPWMREMRDEEPPEGDVVAILRKAAKCTSANTSVGDVLRYNVLGNEPSAWQTEEDACEALADMVERDYVRRDGYDFTVDALKYMKAERDEWKTKCETCEVAYSLIHAECHELSKRVDELTAERDELKRELEIADRHEFESDQACDECKEHTDEHLAEIKAKRDEWKAKYLGAMNDAEDYKSLWMHSRERSGKSVKRAAAVERLRMLDEFGGGSFEYAILGSDKMAWSYIDKRDALIDLLTDDDGVTNLEWLFEHDYETLCDQMGGQPCSCCVVGCEEDLGSDEACAKALREWLMAPHEDGAIAEHQSGVPGITLVAGNVAEMAARMLDTQSDTNGTCPDANRTASKDYGQNADMSEKSAVCVRNDGFMSENGVRADDVDANDGNENLGSDLGSVSKVGSEVDSREKLCTLDVYGKDGKLHSSTDIPKPSWELDSREKLEADIRGHFWHYDWCRVDMVLGWLDRQAAIEKRRFFDGIAEHQADNLKLQSRIRELESERERNRRQIYHLIAQCYGMDGLTATAKIRELQRKVDSLTEQKDTLISYVEADGTRYSEIDGNQVFDHSDLASGDYHEEWHRACVERDDLARTLGETMAEREMYRDLCSQMLDAMDEVRVKVDASFPRGGKEVM